MKERINFILRLLIGFGILFILFKVVPYKELLFHLKKVKPFLLLIAFLSLVSLNLIGVSRWKYILSHLGLHVKYKDLFFLVFCGLFLNLFFPSLIAQDVFRAGLLSLKEPKSLKKIVASLVVDRFSGFFALCFVVTLAFILGRDFISEKSVFIAISLLFLLVVFLALFIFSKSFFKMFMSIFSKFRVYRDKAIEFHECLYVFHNQPRVLFRIFTFSFLIQGSLPFIFYLMACSFAVKVNPLLFMVLIPIIMAISNLPVSIAGLGTREAAAVYFFSKIGIDKSIALGISLMYFLFMLLLGLFGGFLYVAFYSRRIQSHKQNR